MKTLLLIALALQCTFAAIKDMVLLKTQGKVHENLGDSSWSRFATTLVFLPSAGLKVGV